ncbi:MAG: 50S ribosomal protein L32 [Rhizobacter sp.]|nr:50S ribosomal protein L32 [Chlorobiales bacterium]
MPNPKRKMSKTRRDKRRTHYKATAPAVAVDPATGQPFLSHRAYEFEGNTYFKGRIIATKKAKETK